MTTAPDTRPPRLDPPPPPGGAAAPGSIPPACLALLRHLEPQNRPVLLSDLPEALRNDKSALVWCRRAGLVVIVYKAMWGGNRLLSREIDIAHHTPFTGVLPNWREVPFIPAAPDRVELLGLDMLGTIGGPHVALTPPGRSLLIDADVAARDAGPDAGDKCGDAAASGDAGGRRPSWDGLNDRQRAVLRALRDAGAVTAEDRLSSDQIADRVTGERDGQRVRREVAALRKPGLVDTKQGAGGGRYLTPAGLALIPEG
jgi:hypothetical protein